MPAGLILLGAAPLAAGTVSLSVSAAPPSPAVLLHALAAAPYTLLGGLQFAPGLRARRPGLHRAAGRLLVVCGLVVALTGLWLAVANAWHDGPLPTGFRIAAGTLMAGSIVLGYAAIRRRDIARHRAWMARGYALGLGAGTQLVLLAFASVISGPPGPLSTTLLMGLAWAGNLAVAEWGVRRRPQRLRRSVS
ncbi:membrane protein [Sinosporangium siamense]|uniref:Membrane protein n=1 Tax=Sinosporangium siamense TaxID=1367973 RepID=A0A919RGM0_9ACTN|nr:membrane protein [Sinosporangium siamense]